MEEKKVVPGTGGDHYVPYSERSGGESVVFFTRLRKGLERFIRMFRRL